MLDERNVDGTGSPRLEVAQVAWLAPGILLVAGSFGGRAEEEAFASLAEQGSSRRLECRLGPGGVLVVAAPNLAAALAGGATLVLELGGSTLSLGAQELQPLSGGLQSLVRGSLAPLDPAARAEASAFLSALLDLAPDRERTALSRKLHEVREALRERLPLYTVKDTRPFGLNIDRILAVDDRSFYFEGWIHNEGKQAVRVTAVSPEGGRAELFERMFRFPRPDVAQLFSSQRLTQDHGFLCFVELTGPSLLPEGWVCEMETVAGAAVEVACPPVTEDAIVARDAILRNPVFERIPDDELMSEHVHPALTRLREALGGEASVDDVVQFGTPPETPDVSIVVPLYERIEHLEMQLAEFVHDPEISGVDLIYVLDSPELADELLERASQLTPLYRVPFRVCVLEENVGFAEANNAGALLSRGRLLLLLNSDILPDTPGWLSKMQRFYDSTENIGALGPKLLYEDDSIQHAGMYFYNLPGTSQWVDAHYFKGMHRSLPAANVPRRVPILSGACLMIDRALYQRFEGLRGMFVRGDYEDFDLCLRLSEEGLENWYFPGTELYHLEGQSYTSEARRPANRYNMWLHTHLWGDRIAAMMSSE